MRGRVARVRRGRLVLVVSGRRILRGIVLLWIMTLLLFPSAVSKEAPLRWRGVLVRITLLLVIWDEGQVLPRDPPSPAHATGREGREYAHENGGCDGDTCSGAQSFPANEFTGRVVKTVSLSHCGRR